MDKYLNQNTPNFWNHLLSQKAYLEDLNRSVKERIKFAIDNVDTENLILNIGSGQGFFEKKCQYKKINSNIISLDISSNGLNNLKNISPFRVNGSIRHLPFKRNNFKSIVCMEVLEHLSRNMVNTAYNEIKRVAKFKSNIILSVPLYEPISLIDHPVGHLRKYTSSEFISEIKENGFIIKKIRYVYAFKNLYTLKSIISSHYKFRRPSNICIVCQKQ